MSSKKLILVVDDDQEIRELLQEYLNKAGYHVISAADGDVMRQLLKHHHPALIVLDIMMPGDDGFTLCKEVRQSSHVPIIMLTAASDEVDRVIGLELGADDYLAKPFSPRELLARIKAQLRRSEFSGTAAVRHFRFMDWQLDAQSRRLQQISNGKMAELSGSEFNLLLLFLENPSKILSRDAISEYMRGRDTLPTERGIDVLLSRLRQRLGDNAKNPQLIKTIRGAGYVMVADVEHER